VKRIVGVTCETCAVQDCLERAAPPIVLERKKRHEKTDAVVQQFMNQYS
jgi:predicted transcriptional regulator